MMHLVRMTIDFLMSWSKKQKDAEMSQSMIDNEYEDIVLPGERHDKQKLKNMKSRIRIMWLQ